MAADTTDLQVTVQEPESWSRRLSITVPRERVQRTRRSVTSQVAGRVRLPGFRKGKTPGSLIEKQFGAHIEQETLDQLIQEAFREALRAHDLQPLTQGQVENVQYERDADLTFEVHFEVQPTVDLALTSGFAVERPSTEVGEPDVDNVLERLRADRAVLKPMEGEATPDYGDQVTVEITDITGVPEGGEEPESQTFRFELGEGQAIPDIEEAIRTLAVGEEGTFTVRFPEDFPDAAQAGQEQRLRISLTSAHKRELPELDDDFARDLGDFDDLPALRARILEDLKKDAERRAEDEVRARLVQQVVEANPFTVPDSMVQRWTEYTVGLMGPGGQRREMTPEQEEQFSQYAQVLRPQAEAAVKRMLIVETLADREGLRATADDVDARVEKLAEEAGREPKDVWLQLERSGQMQALEMEITEDRVFDYLKQQNTVS